MTERTVTQGTFSLERTYPAPRERVFAAFATAEGKAAWFEGGKGYTTLERVFDVREGGRERVVGRWENGVVSEFDATYFDVIANERIVYAYEMRLSGTKISVSLATIEFKPAGQGTRLVITEAGAFLDGYDDSGSREEGTGKLMDQLGRYLERVPA